MSAQQPEAQPLQPSDRPPAFMAWDDTLGRYVGRVHRGDGAKEAASKSPQAKAARKAGHRVQVRQL